MKRNGNKRGKASSSSGSRDYHDDDRHRLGIFNIKNILAVVIVTIPDIMYAYAVDNGICLHTRPTNPPVAPRTPTRPLARLIKIFVTFVLLQCYYATLIFAFRFYVSRRLVYAIRSAPMRRWVYYYARKPIRTNCVPAVHLYIRIIVTIIIIIIMPNKAGGYTSK